ncbi:MAG: DUF971 domain-containing protein [Myxococcaceae bacterium]
MSFWDHIKPTALPPAAAHLEVSGEGKVLRLTWDDGVRTAVAARTLRQQCPCAACVDEWTHQRTLEPEAVSAEVTLREVRPAGNYALHVHFTDGHSTGIFNWKTLRELSERFPSP